ncbi:hypothetical protein ACP70R_032459 [Stipagrostis hirtigluma subsp. patula]
MAPIPSDVVLQAAVDGDHRRLKKMAKKMDLRKATGIKGQNALHFLALKSRLETCRFLIEELGFDVNSRSAEGETPMFFAAINGSIPLLQYLLDRGGDPAAPDSRGFTPLHNAADYGRCEAVRLLLSKGVPVAPVSYCGTPLHLAAARDYDQVVKILLEHGADPNIVVKNVLPPLVNACYGNSLKCMKLLIEAGADANTKMPTGRPVLMAAVEEGFTDIVKFLLEVGADPNISDEDGKTPIMLAATDEQRELVEILLPWTKPVPFVPDWSVDGIIRTVKYVRFGPQDSVSVEQQIAEAKSKGKKAFAKGDYLAAVHFYMLAIGFDPHDATLFANRSLCWLRLREGELALSDAQKCQTLRPDWAKAWYREGAALSFLKDHEGAVDAFEEALRLDPTSNEIKKALREARESVRKATRAGELNP